MALYEAAGNLIGKGLLAEMNFQTPSGMAGIVFCKTVCFHETDRLKQLVSRGISKGPKTAPNPAEIPLAPFLL
ncbi:MAG: hypothetical protein HFG63_10300 [Lachnospiraceae bacterium]|nr:hypothetical protein [Lachnospiraceae bacterium]